MELVVFVSAGCAGCERARGIVTLVAPMARARRTEVRVVDVVDETPPAHVVATPAYVLDGAVLFLGNPTLAELVAALDGGGPMGRRSR